MQMKTTRFLLHLVGLVSLVEAGFLNQQADISLSKTNEVNQQHKDTNINEIHDYPDLKENLTKADAEIDRLKLEIGGLYQKMQKLTKVDVENDRLKLEREQLHQRIQNMAPPVLNYEGHSDRGHYDPQNPWDWFQSSEPKSAPHSVQVAELTNTLEQTKMKLQHTQTEFQQTKEELKQMQEKCMKVVFSKAENIGSQTLNDKIMKKEEACQDLKSTKTCKKLKKKNEGKGCENKSVKKKCKKTCGLCDVGNVKSWIFQGGVFVDVSFISLDTNETDQLDNEKKNDILIVLHEEFCDLDDKTKAQDDTCSIQNLELRPDGNGTFVNFLVVMNPSYIETRLTNVMNNLGKDQKNSGLNFAGSVMQAVQSCPGGVPLFDGACPDFVCHGPLSCNNNGNCNSDGTACECKAGYSGPDCSFNLVVDCEPWKFLGQNGDTCKKCVIGAKPKKPHRRECVPCPSIHDIVNKTTGECEACPEGQFPNGERYSCSLCKPEEMISFDDTCKSCPDGYVPSKDRTFCKQCAKSLISKEGICQSCPDPIKMLPNETQTGCYECPGNLIANTIIAKCWCQGDLVFNDKQDNCICPGDKMSSPSNPSKCICSEDSIQVFDDKCLMCSEAGAVPNENQTACVECKDDLDCPNEGENYKCISNVCSCVSGHVLDGQDCVVPVKLIGNGSSATEGYIQLFDTTNNVWGGICEHSFSIIDGHVICRSLGFHTAIVALSHTDAAALYGNAPSNSNFTLDNLKCSGLETSIFDCPLTGESNGNCQPSQIAGVKCSNGVVCNAIGDDDVFSCCSSNNQCGRNQGDCDSDNDCSGNLVCGSDNCQFPFPLIADCCTECNTETDCPANYICYDNACQCPNPLVLDGDNCIECITPEDCPNGGKNFKCIANECECLSPFILDADKCIAHVRLGGVGSSETEGYVEALGTNGQWGGVCDDNFDIYDAHVVCRMLGYAFAREALVLSTADDLYGIASSGDTFVLDELNCLGNEESVFDCPHNGEWEENCEKEEIAGVQCSSTPECEENADCPNEGKNYICIANLCQCANGFELNGENCEVQEMVTLLVTGGSWSGGLAAKTRRTEIIKKNFKTEVCKNVQIYPSDIYAAAGSTWKNGKFTICGGFDSGGFDGFFKSECYSIHNGEWEPTKNNLLKARTSHGSSNIGNAILITGGWNGQTFASTEIMHPDDKITSGPDLPQARWSHCQISHEETTFILGGDDSDDLRTDTVWKFNSSNLNKDFEDMKSMMHKRSRHACTIFKSILHDGRPVMIAAGSLWEDESGSKTAEIYDFTKEGTTWQEIGKLPEKIVDGPRMTSTPEGNNVIMTYKKSIYTLKIKGSKYKWKKLPNSLSISRKNHVQLLVPASTIKC